MLQKIKLFLPSSPFFTSPNSVYTQPLLNLRRSTLPSPFFTLLLLPFTTYCTAARRLQTSETGGRTGGSSPLPPSPFSLAAASTSRATAAAAAAAMAKAGVCELSAMLSAVSRSQQPPPRRRRRRQNIKTASTSTEARERTDGRALARNRRVGEGLAGKGCSSKVRAELCKRLQRTRTDGRRRRPDETRRSLPV